MKTYVYNDFDFVDSYVRLPAGTVVYRGVPESVRDDQVVRDRPIYLGPKTIAKHYGRVCALATTRELRLLDVRKMAGLLRYVMSETLVADGDALTCLAYLSMAYGVVSYARQVSLLESYYASVRHKIADPRMHAVVDKRLDAMKKHSFAGTPHNQIEPQGVRTGDANINGYCVAALGELFGRLCDGYVAPRLRSPYQEEGFVHEEIVVFDPVGKMRLARNDDVQPEEEHLSRLFEGVSVPVERGRIRVQVSRGGGKRRAGGYREDPNAFFDDEDNRKDAERLARAFRKHFASKVSFDFDERVSVCIDPLGLNERRKNVGLTWK